MAKPTPGPWRVFDVFTDIEIVTDRPTAHLTESIVQFKGQANARANATLMAAAPTMRDALDYVDMELSAFTPDALKKLGLDVAAEKIRDALADAGVSIGVRAEPVPSVAEILADPKRFLSPEQTNGNGPVNGNGRKM